MNSTLTNEQKDMLNFRENILAKVSETQNTCTTTHNQMRDYIDHKLNIFELAFEKMTMKIADIHNTYISNKYRIEKVDGLEKFKEYADEEIVNLKGKFLKLNEDYNHSCLKYDKVIFENLDVPGIVGDYGKFKNLREYIEVMHN